VYVHKEKVSLRLHFWARWPAEL